MISYIQLNPKDLSRNQIIKIIEICAEDFPTTLGSPQRYIDPVANKLYNNSSWILAYDENQNLLGFISFYINNEGRFAYIPYLWVSSLVRNQSCGTTMLNKLKEQINKNFEKLLLEVKKENANAIRFYYKNGFIKIEERDSTYLLECTQKQNDKL